jgi:hypothetical protein
MFCSAPEADLNGPVIHTGLRANGVSIVVDAELRAQRSECVFAVGQKRYSTFTGPGRRQSSKRGLDATVAQTVLVVIGTKVRMPCAKHR